MSDEDVAARSKAAEEQNKKAQEEAQKQVEKEAADALQAQKDAIGKPTSTAGMTFAEAAAATEALNQPPNPGAEKETTSGTPPPQTATKPTTSSTPTSGTTSPKP